MTENNVLYQGAEAKIILTSYMGRRAICKKRIRKKYRIKQIDDYLISYRTKEEVKLMSASRKAGVCVPLIYDVDLKKGAITMEYLKGERVKDFYNNLSFLERKKICVKIGEDIGRLHNHDIIHGDITTSNLIVYKKRVHFIDFGLGEINPELEAKGVDLHVLMEAMGSTHSQHLDDFKYVFEGYKKTFDGDVDAVKRKIEEIIKRGRYR